MIQALALEVEIADRECLVDQQQIRLEMRRQRKRKPGLHARAVGLDRHVDELVKLCERHDLIEQLARLTSRYAVQRGTKLDILASAQQLAERAPELDDPFGTSVDPDLSAVRLEQAEEQF